MKKRILSIIFILIMMFNCVYVSAEENDNELKVYNENINFEADKVLDGIGNITIKQSIIINGEKNNLYPTFDNPSDAIEKVSTRAYDYLKLVAEQNSLTKLSKENWREYYSAIDNCSVTSNYVNDKYLMEVFFDIYKNEDNNEDIIHLLDSDENEKYEALAMMLPYDSPYCTEYFNNKNQVMEYIDFNIEAAINYANTYAVHANVAEYGEIQGKDCTNFASQILENGGFNQISGTSVYSGWWHKKKNNKHTYSQSWTVADKFRRVLGISYSTKSHYEFSKKLKPGDFIAISYNNGSSWSHIGFVTKVDNYVGDYGYYDYFVAQHSGNYLAWTSTEENDWEVQSGCTYGIIRYW